MVLRGAVALLALLGAAALSCAHGASTPSLTDQIRKSSGAAKAGIASYKGTWLRDGVDGADVDVATMHLPVSSYCPGLNILGEVGLPSLLYFGCSNKERRGFFNPAAQQPVAYMSLPPDLFGFTPVSVTNTPTDTSAILLTALQGSGHMSSDAGCDNPVGCDDVELFLQGDALLVEQHAILLVSNETLAYPPLTAACTNFDPFPRKAGGSAPTPLRTALRSSARRGSGARQEAGARPSNAGYGSNSYGYGSSNSGCTTCGGLPATVYRGSAYVASGYVTAVDRHTKRQLADGWFELAWPFLYTGDDDGPFGGDGEWTAIPSSQITTSDVIIANPYEATLQLWKGGKAGYYSGN